MRDFFEFSKRKREHEQLVHTKGLAVGIGIGVLVGAVAGILMAPKAGKETRQDIFTSYNWNFSNHITC